MTTDGEADGATLADWVETSVTTTTAGNVTISEGLGVPTEPGFVLLGVTVSITAPLGTAANPLTLSFTIDASQIPAGVRDPNSAVKAVPRG